MELQLGNLRPLRCNKKSQSFPGLLVICVTWEEANFTIVFKHQDAHSVFRVHVCRVFKTIQNLIFSLPMFCFDTKVIIEPVEPSGLFSGVSRNAVCFMMELI